MDKGEKQLALTFIVTFLACFVPVVLLISFMLSPIGNLFNYIHTSMEIAILVNTITLIVFIAKWKIWKHLTYKILGIIMAVSGIIGVAGILRVYSALQQFAG